MEKNKNRLQKSKWSRLCSFTFATLAIALLSLALLPNGVMAEGIHQPTETTAVVVATAIEAGAVPSNATAELKATGYTVSVLDRFNSTAENLNTSLDAGVIVWIGHGDYVGGQVILGTPEWAYPEDTMPIYLKYKDDFDSSRLVWRNVTFNTYPPETWCYVFITPSFISHYYHDLPNSLWYTCSCLSLADDSMANAFLNSGGAVYMGWNAKVGTAYGNDVTKEVVTKFCIGYTVDEVMSAGYVDPNTQAALGYVGDGEFSITDRYSYLAIQVPQAPEGGVNVWIDGVLYQSPVNISVTKGSHTIEVQYAFEKEGWKPGWYYTYTFNHWSDGSTDNPRTVYLRGNTVFIAYYLRSQYPHL